MLICSYYVSVRNNTSILRAYSNYFEVIQPGITADVYIIVDDWFVFTMVIQIFAIFIGIALVVCIIVCLVYHFNEKHAGAGDEVISLRDSLRFEKIATFSNVYHYINSICF